MPWMCFEDGLGGESRDIRDVTSHKDWREYLWDKRDISTGQTGHVHGIVEVHKRGCPVEFLYTLRIFSCYFQPFGLFPFCKVIFGDPPKIPFKTSAKLTSLGLF